MAKNLAGRQWSAGYWVSFDGLRTSKVRQALIMFAVDNTVGTLRRITL